MDATRLRRTRDQIRQTWYAKQRCQRFARHFDKPNQLDRLPNPPSMLPPTARPAKTDGNHRKSEYHGAVKDLLG